MISWLQGERIDSWEEGSKKGILLSVNGVGYEIQILPRQEKSLSQETGIILWIHHLHREDSSSFFGFLKKEERDLFRMVISVNGIGPQTAISLLEKNEENDLIQAVLNKDIKKLSQAQGVGKKTAERLILELIQKLSNKITKETQENIYSGLSTSDLCNSPSSGTEFKEVIEILQGLGYQNTEINQAIYKVTHHSNPEESLEILTGSSNKGNEDVLKASLVWLSQEAA